MNTSVREGARTVIRFVLAWIALWYASAGLLVPVLPGYYRVAVPPIVGLVLAIVFVHRSYSLDLFFRFLLIAFLTAAVLFTPIIGTIVVSDLLPELDPLSPPFALAAIVNALSYVIAYYVVYVSHGEILETIRSPS